MGNVINFSLGLQKGRATSSLQAIKKWEADINFIDENLHSKLNT